MKANFCLWFVFDFLQNIFRRIRRNWLFMYMSEAFSLWRSFITIFTWNNRHSLWFHIIQSFHSFIIAESEQSLTVLVSFDEIIHRTEPFFKWFYWNMDMVCGRHILDIKKWNCKPSRVFIQSDIRSSLHETIEITDPGHSCITVIDCDPVSNMPSFLAGFVVVAEILQYLISPSSSSHRRSFRCDMIPEIVSGLIFWALEHFLEMRPSMRLHEDDITIWAPVSVIIRHRLSAESLWSFGRMTVSQSISIFWNRSRIFHLWKLLLNGTSTQSMSRNMTFMVVKF